MSADDYYLAEAIRRAKEQAWDEGARWMSTWNYTEDFTPEDAAHNPYRQGKTS